MRIAAGVVLSVAVVSSALVIGMATFRLIQADYEKSKDRARIIECLYAIDHSACAETMTRR